ncbi:FtsX-like permease family protein [Ferrimonas sp. YFM]|uniref:ABC transporter permease n=1 Tax=Ferrimonas sp. YFM TaxID=3028878 RepID=UPI002573BD36|nr:FtsX-like permease family protein [Ferrimonas sp. YFM]BDY04323.1 ABC transporter permease [Ferrimonas sp. YFM]
MGKLIPHWLRLALLNLSRNRRRTLLSMVIVAIAVYALTASAGFGLFTYRSLQEAAARDTGHLTLSHPRYFEQEEAMPLALGFEPEPALMHHLAEIPEVRAVLPRVHFTGLVSNGNKSTIFMGIGVSHREFAVKGPFLTMNQGHPLLPSDSPRYNPEEPAVLLGQSLADNLAVTVGDWITLLATTSDGALNALDFKVGGVFTTGVPELDKRQLYLGVSDAQSLLVSSRISTLSLYLDEMISLVKVGTRVEALVRDLDQPLVQTPWQERAFFYHKVRNLYDGIFGLLGMVMALVVFVALFNTLTMSVAERTREIGTLSAMGARPSEIICGFLKESALMACLGATLGVTATALTSLILMLVPIQMPPPPGRTQGYPLHIDFSPPLALMVTLMVLSICLVAALMAARRGVKQPIIEALAHV